MRYDIIVIGSGPGGYAVAIRASQLGRKVAVVERAEEGGTCVNWGCIPTKALIRSAHVFNDCRNAGSFGVELACDPVPDMAKIVARSRTVAANMSKGVQFLLKKNNVDVIHGFGRLASASSVDVDGTIYEAGNIILATGARPRELPSIPVDHKHVITSKDALSLDRLPESMVVIGSGAIGIEFAWLYATLGTKVTLVEYMPQIMPLEDEEVAAAVERSFRRMRVNVMTSATVRDVTPGEFDCEVVVEGKKGEERLSAEIVLSATGIQPNIEGLGLEELGIRTERGRVVVDFSFRTSVEGIYAIGDIIATPALAHVATAEAIRCAEIICGLTPAEIDYGTIPSCVFTSPEVASVGLTEKQAQERGIEYRVGRFPFSSSGRAMASGEREGFAKLIFDSEERLIGAHLVGANVTEMLGEAALAKQLGATAGEIARTIHAHPTMSEGIMEAAMLASEAAKA